MANVMVVHFEHRFTGLLGFGVAALKSTLTSSNYFNFKLPLKFKKNLPPRKSSVTAD